MRAFLLRLRFFAVMGAAGGVLMLVSCVVAYLTHSVVLGGLAGTLVGTGVVIKGVIEDEERGGREGDGLVLGLAAAIAAGLAGFVGCVPLMEIRRLGFAAQREVSLEELARHPEVARFRLRDGHVAAHAVRTKYHRHDDKEPVTSYRHAVAPVLPPSWRPGEPVRVWAVCNNFSGDEERACLEAWHEPAGGAIAVDPELESCFQLVVPPESVPRDERPVFVLWVKSPEAYLAEHWRDFLGFLRGTAIGWGITAGLWLVGSSAVSGLRTVGRRWRKEE